jgi:hydroxypyruvate isomerase
MAIGTASMSAVSTLAQEKRADRKPFKLKYAPHIGQAEAVAGKDIVDQIKYMHDQGFTAWEDNQMNKRTPDEQTRIAKEMEKLEMTMGVFVAYGDFNNPTFSGNRMERDKKDRDKAAVREMLKNTMNQAVEVAKRVNAQWCTLVPGAEDPGLEAEYQFANVVEHLKFCSEICEKSGLIMVLESLNPYRNHPGLYLKRIPQAYAICKAVGSPSCKILDDLYHQQITEGNLIHNIDAAWDEIAYFQIGDNPGRNEPGTGEINYKNVFRHIYKKGFKGIMGMEHGISKKGPEGVRALIDAYLQADDFEA